MQSQNLAPVQVEEATRSADDDIDAMSVSLTSRCYDLLAREQPVASDLRLIVSVLRVLGEFERHELETAFRPRGRRTAAS